MCRETDEKEYLFFLFDYFIINFVSSYDSAKFYSNAHTHSLKSASKEASENIFTKPVYLKEK